MKKTIMRKIIFLIFFVMFLIGFAKIVFGCVVNNVEIGINGFKQVEFSFPFWPIPFLYLLFKGELKDTKMNKKKKGRSKLIRST